MTSFLSSATSWLGRSQVLSNYAIQDGSSAAGSSSGGPVKIGLWTVSPAKHRSSGKSVSVWSYEKATAASSKSAASRGAAARAEALIVEQLKAEVSKLTKMRMPCVLETTEPLEETRSGLIWASEPVTCSLRAALAASSTSTRERLDAYNLELDEVEVSVQRAPSKRPAIQILMFAPLHFTAPEGSLASCQSFAVLTRLSTCGARQHHPRCHYHQQ